jgi:serine/threonine-protein kinase HipA
MNLAVRYEGRRVASFTYDAAALVATYDRAWLEAADRFPISLSIPLTKLAIGADLLIPWLLNLLPEGEPLRAMTQILGASADDVMGLILETGGDLAGALSIGRHSSGEPGYLKIPDEAALDRIIAELPARPFLAGEEGVTMSLAGAQDKLPVALLDEELAIPLNGAPSTHILKPDNPRLFGSVQNEALSMLLARRIGLPTAAVTTGIAGSRSYLLVERYDRLRDGNPIRRLHQEDFCQALGLPPSAKFEFNQTPRRGPSLPDMFALVREHMTALDTNRLLDAVIFNIAIGNVDSHAKNYSILLQPQVRLAPLYDLMSPLAWEGITSNHAQDIGGQRRGAHVYGRHWERLAAASGLAPRGTVRRVERVTEAILDELEGALEEVAAMPTGNAFLDLFADGIRKRATAVRDHSKVAGDRSENLSTEPSEIPGQASAYPG